VDARRLLRAGDGQETNERADLVPADQLQTAVDSIRPEDA
jgi:hypothetical protein